MNIVMTIPCTISQEKVLLDPFLFGPVDIIGGFWNPRLKGSKGDTSISCIYFRMAVKL